MNTREDFAVELKDLVSAEDFFDYFELPYQIEVLRVKRLHILQRFHDYLARQEAGKPPCHAAYRHWLALAYQDLCQSDAQTEKVFAVFQRGEGDSFMPLSQLLG